jgi:hypothetical protein
MVGGENRFKETRSASAAEKQIITDNQEEL